MLEFASHSFRSSDLLVVARGHPSVCYCCTTKFRVRDSEKFNDTKMLGMYKTLEPPPENHHLHGKLENAELYVDTQRTSITYTQLADALRTVDSKVGESLDDVSDKTLYNRVWDWCHKEARVLSVLSLQNTKKSLFGDDL